VISAPSEIYLKLKIKTMVGHLLLSLSLTYLFNEDTQQNRPIRVYISGIFAVGNSQERKRAIASPAVHESAEESQLARERQLADDAPRRPAGTQGRCRWRGMPSWLMSAPTRLCILARQRPDGEAHDGHLGLQQVRRKLFHLGQQWGAVERNFVQVS
jgi:hypothetical protein